MKKPKLACRILTSLSLVGYAATALSVLLIPRAIDSQGRLTALGYTAGSLFWIGLIFGLVCFILAWNKARKEGYAAPGKDAVPDDWSTQDKFLIVVETASLNETELAEYARKKGLYVEQIKAWKDACMNANGGIAKEAARLNRELKESQKERKKLEKEIQRKDKALAEAAALLVLSKKANAIWGDPEDEK